MELIAKRLRDEAILPTRGSAQAAGYDLYAAIDSPVTIPAGETRMIPLGWAFALPEGFAAFLYARSGLAAKHGLAPANCVGICDADYRGEYMVPLHNASRTDYTVQAGERVAQMVLAPYYTAEFTLSDELPETDRGEGGFGSTGH